MGGGGGGVGGQVLQLGPVSCSFPLFSFSASCAHMQSNQAQLPAPAAMSSPP